MSAKLLKKISAIIFVSGFFIMSCSYQVFAADTIRIAVLDFQANDTSKYAAAAVSEFISMEMAKKNELTVIEKNQIGAILNEQGFKQSGCIDQDCAVEMGKLLSARKILLGSLAKTGKVFVITAKSVDVETGRIDFAVSERCMKEEDLELASKILAVKLVNNITGTNYSLPMRNFQQDESRNRFGLGILYKYGVIKNVKIPEFKTDFESLSVTSSKGKVHNQSAVLSPSYEFTDNLGIRADFKYIFSKIDDTSLEKYNSDMMPPMESNYMSIGGVEINNGYGFALNLQLIYPMEGFNLFIIPGIGIDKYSLEKSEKIQYLYNDMSGNLQLTGNYELKSEVYSYMIKFETGFSVFVSRYLDLFFSAGIDYHLLSKLISDIKINETSRYVTGTVSSDKQNMLKNATIEFKGNFPPEYYAQAGVVLRLF
jgi:TolB-like protein